MITGDGQRGKLSCDNATSCAIVSSELEAVPGPRFQVAGQIMNYFVLLVNIWIV